RQEKSDWGITYEKTESVVPAYSGLIYVDQDTHEVLRVTLEAQNIPPAFPVQEATTTLDYDYVDISGQRYLLPLKFEMRMRQGKLLIKNEVEFRLYRKFQTETLIKFDTPEPLPEEMLTEQQP
ncbi:MAG: hypothetical protein GY953_28575, partial [bacterium]|nr:hypothetical protein [bacterium]